MQPSKELSLLLSLEDAIQKRLQMVENYSDGGENEQGYVCAMKIVLEEVHMIKTRYLRGIVHYEHHNDE
jgi:hypothetical protein